eukprot:m.25096 g.25096  ORF g.25096 m.25096 type:complete len:437 (-) comp14875_c0_seq1:223-1533(-)
MVHHYLNVVVLIIIGSLCTHVAAQGKAGEVCTSDPHAVLVSGHCICRENTICEGLRCSKGSHMLETEDHGKMVTEKVHAYVPSLCPDCACKTVLPKGMSLSSSPTPPQTLTPSEPHSPTNFSCQALTSSARDGPYTMEQAKLTTVHVLVANEGVIPLLHNLICSMRRLNIDKFVVLGMDNKTCASLASLGLIRPPNSQCFEYRDRMIELMKLHEPETFKQEAKVLENITEFKAAANWATAPHKIMINTKLYAALDVLQCNFGIFLTDADVVFLEDPFEPFAKVLRENPTVETIFQDDTTNQFDLSLNSGFFLWLPTKRNKQFALDVVKYPVFWWIDQARVNNVLAKNYSKHNSWHRLPPRPFPNGNYVNQMIRFGETFPVRPDSKVFGGVVKVIVAHVNWSESFVAKLKMLRATGLWLVGSDTETCYQGDLPAPKQ